MRKMLEGCDGRLKQSMMDEHSRIIDWPWRRSGFRSPKRSLFSPTTNNTIPVAHKTLPLFSFAHLRCNPSAVQCFSTPTLPFTFLNAHVIPSDNERAVVNGLPEMLLASLVVSLQIVACAILNEMSASIWTTIATSKLLACNMRRRGRNPTFATRIDRQFLRQVRVAAGQ